ncbi:hypothetical protein EVA_05472 [gut metagenome]|uniref:Uncharacterized protein n=1 Tax=gut metagenome TaxID=749906 RepID=J9D1G7_9ZZZZ
MIPADVALNDFTRTGVVYIGTICVFYRRSQITDARVACIFHRHGRIVLGPFLTDNCILKARLFKGFLPVVYTLDEIRTPLLRRSRVDVVNNRLLRLNQFAALHLLRVCAVFRF